jgi:fibronectin type 3 domain-containing protein
MSVIGDRAVQVMTQFQATGAWPQDMDEASAVLAKVGCMLVMYGSKDEAILANIHERGFIGVQLEDVQQIRQFLTE